ncbi:MAG: EamA family transporter [Gemmatimonadota bacterium]
MAVPAGLRRRTLSLSQGHGASAGSAAITPARSAVALAFLTLYLVWGSTYLGIRIAVETLPPFLLAGARFAIAGAIMLLLCRLRGRRLPVGREWIGAAGVGFCLVALGNALIVYVEQRVASGIVALFAAGTPLLIAVFTRRRTGVPLGTRRIAGLILGTAGLAVLGSATLGAVHDIPRVVALAVAMLAWAFGATYGRDWPHAADVVVTSSAQMFAGGLIAVAVSGALGEWSALDVHAITVRSVVAWGYLTVFGSMIAYTVFQWLMSHFDPTAVSSYTYVNPVVALGLGALFAGERVGPRVIVATALLVPAVFLVVAGSGRGARGPVSGGIGARRVAPFESDG